MKFPILIACFLIPSLASGDEAPKSSRFRCGSRAMELPPLDQPRLPRPHSAQVEQPFVPYKILYLIDDTIDQVELARLEKATDYANRRLSKTIKARKLGDVRLQNLDPGCKELCAEMPFPTEYVLPCHPAVIPEPSDEIQKLNEADYTLVARVFVRQQGVVANKQIEAIDVNCDGGPIAFARSCLLMPQEYNNGPHHGFLLLCDKPSSMSDDALGILILHETLHILMPFSLSGLVANNYNCNSKDRCKNRTWKEVKRQAKNEQGHLVEITAGIAIGPLFQTAARDHFGCDSAEGVEFNYKIDDRSTMVGRIDHAHWSEHLFPDELMAPTKATSAHFSNLTLSALASHVKWYKVDQSLAEPLVSSKPSEEFACDAAQKTCFQVLKEQTGKGVKFIRPFCDARNGADRVITTHCSPDHQRQLSCENEVSDSHCAFLMGTNDHIYDNDVCAKATFFKSGTLAAHVGASFGPGTICVTTTSFPPWESQKTNALCLHHECHADTLILKFKPDINDDPNCYITCTKGQSNHLLTMNWCNKAEHEVIIICPDFGQVCKKETTAAATTSTVPKTTTTSSVPTTTSAVLLTTSMTTRSTVPPTTTSIPTTTSTNPPDHLPISTDSSTASTVSVTTSTVPKPSPIASAAAYQSVEILENIFWFHLLLVKL